MDLALGLVFAVLSASITMGTGLVYTTLNSSEGLLYSKYSPIRDEGGSMLTCQNSSLFCSRWSVCGNGTCKCPGISGSILQCNKRGQIRAIKRCFCVTYNGDSDVLEVGPCIYNCHHGHSGTQGYLSLPANMSEWNALQCGKFNRKGALCGECKEGYYIPAYSYSLKCVECSSTALNWWKFVAIAFLPLTVFYFVLLLFKVNIHVTYLHGDVLYCQASTIVQVSRYLFLFITDSPLSVQYLGFSLISFYSVWCLDFFRIFSTNICLRTNLLLTILLDLAVALYPVFLTVLLYLIIWAHDKKLKIVVAVLKPFQHFLKLFPHIWDFKSTLIDVFSTFFFLIGTKCVGVCADYLLYIELYTIHVNGSIDSDYRLFYNASLPYFGSSHFPYAVIAIAVLLAVNVIPTSILLLYPFKFCQALLHKMPRVWQIWLHTYMDSVQGCYGDGTEGSRDFRWVSGLMYVMRFLFLVAFLLSHKSSFRSCVSIGMVFVVMGIIIMDPYKPRFKRLHSYFIIFMLFAAGNYSLMYLSAVHLNSDHVYFLIGFYFLLPAVYIQMVIGNRIIRQTRKLWKAHQRRRCPN